MSGQIKIRQALLKDLDTLVDFNIRMAREIEGLQLDAGLITPGVKTVLEDSKYGFYLVAEGNRKVVGSLMETTG